MAAVAAAIRSFRPCHTPRWKTSLSTFATPATVAPIMPGRRFLSSSSYLVSPTELHEALKKNPTSSSSAEHRVIPLCASWFLPNDGRTGIEVFREKRIPNARFFDLDKAIDKHSPYPHMLPEPQGFATVMSELGIRRDDTVVVYDSRELGIFSAPRVGWTLRLFGHPRVHVLNNFKLWVDQGFPTESGELYSVECCPYPIPKTQSAKVVDFEQVKGLVKNQGTESIQILDARPFGRWAGTAPEPREGLSSGHMPGSINIPFSAVLDPETKTFLPRDKLHELFESKGVNPSQLIVSTCGTGVTACVIDTALEEAGYGSPESRKVYDGSWTEWAQRVKPKENLILKQE